MMCECQHFLRQDHLVATHRSHGQRLLDHPMANIKSVRLLPWHPPENHRFRLLTIKYAWGILQIRPNILQNSSISAEPQHRRAVAHAKTPLFTAAQGSPRGLLDATALPNPVGMLKDMPPTCWFVSPYE